MKTSKLLALFSIVAVLMIESGGGLLGQTNATFRVDNQSDHPVTIKSLSISFVNGEAKVEQKDVANIEAGQTQSVTAPNNSSLSYFQFDKQIGVQTVEPDATVFLRKPGLVFRLTEIYCRVADDEGPHSFGDEIEFNGKLQVKVKYGANHEHEINRDPVHIYIEGMDDNSSRPLGNEWTIPVPNEFLDTAIMTLSWTETWEEDNASSSEDDKLTVEDNNRAIERIQSLGPYAGKFRIIGTDPANPDADVDVKYEVRAIRTFETRAK